MTAQYIARNPSAAWRRLGSDVIVAAAATSEFFVLNEHAAMLWEAADGLRTLRQIVDETVCSVYLVTPDEAYRDAEVTVCELARRGLIRLSAHPLIPGESA